MIEDFIPHQYWPAEHLILTLLFLTPKQHAQPTHQLKYPHEIHYYNNLSSVVNCHQASVNTIVSQFPAAGQLLQAFAANCRDELRNSN